MKTIQNRFRFFVLCFLFFATLFCIPGVAGADTYDDFVGFLEDLEGLGVNLPVTSEQLKDVKGMVHCLENAGNDDVKIALCIDEFKETSAGSGIANQAGIPSYVWKALDCYLLYRADDYWGLAYELGGVAVCVILQVVTANDLCALFDELIDMANALWDTAKAVAEFFASVGGAVYDTVKDVGCSLGLGGCDDGPDTPPEAYVYSLVFGNRLADGLTAREAVSDSAFDNLVAELKQNALHKPEPILSAPPPPDFMGIKDAIYNLFTQASVDKAAKIYIYNVNIQWTNDIATRVLADRAQKMDAYSSPQSVHQIIQSVLDEYTPKSGWHPQMPIINRCYSDLRNIYGYTHVDRWVQYSPISDLGPQAGQLRPNVKSNYRLAGDFYNQIKPEVLNQVRQYVKNNYSPEYGGRLVAQTLENHRNCIEMMQIFSEETQCWANTKTVGKEAKDKIIEEFKKRGSTYYGANSLQSSTSFVQTQNTFHASPASQMTAAASLPTFDPVAFICYRPVHEHHFDDYNSMFFGGLPRPILKRTLNEDPVYKTLRLKVATAVNQLNANHTEPAFLIHPTDPLAVYAASMEDLAIAENANTSYNFGPPSTKPGFEFSQSNYKIFPIDGLSTPRIYHDNSPGDPLANRPLPHLQKQLDMMDPTDPITQNFNRQDMMNPVQLQTSKLNAQTAPVLNEGLQQVQTHGATQPMSGSLPPDQTPQPPQMGFKNGIQLQNKTPRVASTTLSPLSLDLPDLTAQPRLEMNHSKTRWNSAVNITGTDAQIKIPMHFTVQNSGKAPSGSCDFNLTVSGKVLYQKAISQLAPGKSKGVDAFIELEPGNHIVVLMLDSSNKVQESNEGNNRYQINLTITGKTAGKMLTPVLPKTVEKHTLQMKSR